jgi:hypothetical protein
MGPGAPGWELGVGLTTTPRKRTACWKTRNAASERFDEKYATYAMHKDGRSSQGIEGYGGGTLWKRRHALGYGANE